MERFVRERDDGDKVSFELLVDDSFMCCLLEVCIAVFSSPLVRAGLSVVNGTGEVRAVSADGHEVKPRRGRIADPAMGDAHTQRLALRMKQIPRCSSEVSVTQGEVDR